MAKVRINRYLAQSAGLSKRKADEAIAEGRVSLNGRVMFDKGKHLDPEMD
ncbi:MAG: pseudouridine synthase, partial [Deltaproteobacteria bacterium]|nr:pseudouridine synthase [Deltaproteobacteria bacterium]NIS78290.1 pseudouridine synthase [Deltaproteobacteria bacterium]